MARCLGIRAQSDRRRRGGQPLLSGLLAFVKTVSTTLGLRMNDG